MTRSNAKVTFHLPFIYGDKAKSTQTKEEQVNRLDSFWFCEAQRPPSITDTDDRIEAPKASNIYVIENRRLQSLLVRRKPQHRVKPKKAPRPRIVDDLISLEYRYQQSAKVVQRAWRRFSARSFWQRYFLAIKAAVTIQRHVRGILCRKFVRVWYRSRLRFVSKIQAVFRGHLSRRVLQSQLQWEHYNVNVIQRWSRGHFGRRRARAARRHMAAERIQCLWRGVQSRQQSDRLWLSAKATTIQRHMRGFLARKHTQCQSQRCHAAAVAMQRLFRGTLARTRIDAMLRDRETHNRKVVMNVLDAEIAWQTAYIDKLQRRLAKSRLEVTVVELEVELHRLHVQINDMECIYIDMSDQRAKMSPRAITDGWLSEMEMKMATQRRMITAAKLDAVFGHGYTFKQHDAKLTDHRDQLARATFRKHQLVKWRTEEFVDYWTREMNHLARVRDEAHRRNVAEQRRKWAVKFYNKSGKVQRHRPAPRVDTTISMVNTNLLATSSATTDSSDDVIANLSDQVKLVTVQSQLAQATEMFTPLLQRFSSTHSAVHQMTRDCKPNPPPLADNFVNQAAAEAQVSSDSVTTMPISPTKSKLKSPTKAQASLLAPPKSPLRSATVPWSLLDQLEAEKVKFKTEQAARKAGFTTNKHRKEVPVPSNS